VAGSVIGIRFYKGVLNMGTHTGSLWTSAGTLLATGVFSNETSSGWQTMMFSSPVAIAANTTYVASYHSASGVYGLTFNYFQGQGADNAPLHALATGLDGPNGVYIYGPGGQFPSNDGYGNNYWVDVAFTPGSTPTTPTPVPQPSPGSTSKSLWPDTSNIVIRSTAPGDPIEVGVKFRSDVAGNITGIRFYKGVLDTGTHTGSLWTSAGTLLATGVFSNETSSGWQTLMFSSPVAISANTTYVASYHSANGVYGLTFNYFQSHGTDNAPLHALASGADGPNGVYIYGPGGQFPSNDGYGNNYWVDVVFSYLPN
jgi:hypothetical protein